MHLLIYIYTYIRILHIDLHTCMYVHAFDLGLCDTSRFNPQTPRLFSEADARRLEELVARHVAECDVTQRSLAW